MSDESESGELRLDSYALEPAEPHALTAFAVNAAPADPGLPVRITVRGGGFRMRAIPLRLRVGEVEVRRLEILPDERTLVGYLDRMPAEGARITVDYGPGTAVEMAEPFTLGGLGGPPVT